MLCITILSLSACVNTRWLRPKEYLLYKQNIAGNERVTKEELEALFTQVPNRKVPIIGSTMYLYFHLLGREFYDSTKYANQFLDKKNYVDSLNSVYIKVQKKDSTLNYTQKDSLHLAKILKKQKKKLVKAEILATQGNFLMRTIGEKPSLFDTNNINYTCNQFHLYLLSKGYLKNKVTYDTSRLGKNYFVKYKVEENVESTIDCVRFDVEDTIIQNVIRKHLNETSLRLFSRYDENTLNDERERITKLLRDNGFYDFTRQYINFQIDTTNIAKVKITLYVDSPEDKPHHTRYKINEVQYHLDYSKTSKKVFDSITYNNVHYNYYGKKYSEKVLNSKNQIFPGEYYSYTLTQNTQRNLSNLELFKFVSINFIKSDTGEFLTAIVNMNSYPKYQLSDEWGINVSQGQGYPGPLGNVTLVDRNIFKGCEILSINLRGSVEGQPSLTQINNVYSTYEYGGNISITSPKVLIPTRFKYKFDNNNPRTKYVFSYQNTIRHEYTRSITKGAINYLFQKGKF